jgi:hypothetical protein
MWVTSLAVHRSTPRSEPEMPERKSPGSPAAPNRSDQPAKAPLTTRLLLRQSLTARRAAAIIAGFTLLITIGGGILERIVDRQEYPTFGRGLWLRFRRSRRSATET